MVLILSNQVDISTCDVIDWISFYKSPFIRLNSDDKTGFIELYIGDGKTTSAIDFEITLNNVKVKGANISSYWYRKGGLPKLLYKTENIEKVFKSNGIVKGIKDQFRRERTSLYEYLYYLLDQIKVKLGSNSAIHTCKLTMLHVAREVGLLVPLTTVVTSKLSAKKFKKENNSIITKGIEEVLHTQDEHVRYFAYTEEVTDKHLDAMSDHFFPCLLQRNIKKAFEIRVFYLNGKCYSMAIFSQSSAQTRVDFRKYDHNKPSRNVPYDLPIEISTKVKKLMEKLKLETGSLDFIVSEENEYFFLEVNPVGQFGMTSSPCNYYLEKKIAQYLTNNHVI